MVTYKPKKGEVLGMILFLYAIIVGFFLNLVASIIYDLLIKSASIHWKIGIMLFGLIITGGIFYIVNEFYIKPFDKTHK